jgi:glycosyltransferase involved in cell wall biosynthesis
MTSEKLERQKLEPDKVESDKMEPISVCISARDEASTIGRTIRSVLAQDLEADVEILVCANACTDGTADVVRRVQAAFPGTTTLIETERPGKANAWNVMRRRAAHDLLFFMDADVTADSSAFGRMHGMLTGREGVVAVAAQNAWLTSDCSLLTRFSLPASPDGVVVQHWQRTICGRLYAFKKAAMERTMDLFGYEEMPPNLLNDDRWIRMMLDEAAARTAPLPLSTGEAGEHESMWEICREALVYSVPADWWSEWPKVRARVRQGHMQLRDQCPELYAHTESRPAAFTTHAARARRGAARYLRVGLQDGAGRLIREVLGRIAEWRADRYLVRRINADRGASVWFRAESSKAA